MFILKFRFQWYRHYTYILKKKKNVTILNLHFKLASNFYFWGFFEREFIVIIRSLNVKF